MSDRHPSYLALDRHAIGVDSSEVAAHVASCSRCRRHVDSVRVAPATPSWVWGEAHSPTRGRRSLIERWSFPELLRRVMIPVAFASALAAVTFLMTPHEDRDSGVSVKGGPAVDLFVKRGEDVWPWARQAIRPGDRLRFRIEGDVFSFATVYSRAGDEWIELYAGKIETGVSEVDGEVRDSRLLPVSWRVDDRGEVERLIVVLSHGPSRGGFPVTELHPDSNTWVARFDLRKEIRDVR